MTLTDRAGAFASAYAKWPAAWPIVGQEQGRDVLYATWLIGNDYRNKTRFYGAYPNGYLERVMALFPDVPDVLKLHVFSGSVAKGSILRLDSNPVHRPEVVGSVYDVEGLVNGLMPFRLVLADPPYTAQDALRYATPMINRGKALRALATITQPGGHLAWLDTVWPMHRKAEWTTVGRITVIRSTNHRVRLLSLFQRTA